ncbi:hypothetical protein [Dyella ginsengisoli]|uniref:hypothetical protein n=1 Tax=Dyella ginsengisoli TaxID=363848 RepID=UPI0012FD9E05|nr:hypothetical protein [Dyella ginsengisoli]
MPDIEPQAILEQSAQRIEEGLREDFGALLTQADLARLLRYPTVQAVRKARSRGYLAIPMFQLPMRRGWFATTRAVAEFLASLEQRSPISTELDATLLECSSAGGVPSAGHGDILSSPLYRPRDHGRPFPRQVDTEKVFNDRRESDRTSTQGPMTKEEAS